MLRYVGGVALFEGVRTIGHFASAMEMGSVLASLGGLSKTAASRTDTRTAVSDLVYRNRSMVRRGRMNCRLAGALKPSNLIVLQQTFDNETRLDIFNNSSGYEGSHARLQVGGRLVSFNGIGGGDIAIFDPSRLVREC
jgi:hypothetical protein